MFDNTHYCFGCAFNDSFVTVCIFFLNNLEICLELTFSNPPLEVGSHFVTQALLELMVVFKFWPEC